MIESFALLPNFYETSGSFSSISSFSLNSLVVPIYLLPFKASYSKESIYSTFSFNFNCFFFFKIVFDLGFELPSGLLSYYSKTCVYCLYNYLIFYLFSELLEKLIKKLINCFIDKN